VSYGEQYNQYLAFLRESGIETDRFTEFKFEALKDFSVFGGMSEVVDWYYKWVSRCTMRLQQIPLTECRMWRWNEERSALVHDSGEFYKVEGYRVTGTGTREVDSGWDQPFLTQNGFDGGILGLIRKRFEGIPHYLIEAKEEPGNYNIVQISTTVQATFSNLKRAHKGKQTNYSDVFLNPEDHPVKIIFDQWTSEDGGRLFNKRNRSMLVEYDEDRPLPLVSDRFRWVSLYQLKTLISEENAIIAPHIRGILAGV